MERWLRLELRSIEAVRDGPSFLCAACGEEIGGPGLIETDENPATYHEECFAQRPITDIFRTADGNYVFGGIPNHLGVYFALVRFTAVRLGGPKG